MTPIFFKIIHGKVPAKSSKRRIVIPKKTGRLFIVSSAQTIKYEADFAKQILGKDRMNIDKRMRVELNVYTPDFRQDIDSFPKVVLDCLQKNGIIKNDNLIDNLIVNRLIDKQNPRVEILISLI